MIDPRDMSMNDHNVMVGQVTCAMPLPRATSRASTVLAGTAGVVLSLGVMVTPCAAQSIDTGGQGRETVRQSPLPSPTYSRTDRGIVDVLDELSDFDEQTPVARRTSRADNFYKGRIAPVSERSETAYSPRGIKAGGFIVTPTVHTTVAYDSNVFKLPDGQSDIVSYNSGDVQASSNWSRHALNFQAHVDNQSYADLKSENATEWNLSSGGVLNIFQRHTLSLDADYGHFVVNRNAVGELNRTARPVRYDRSGVTAQANLVGAAITGQVSASIKKYDYDNAESLTGQFLDQQFRDFTQKIVGGTVEWQGKPGSSIFLSVEQQWRDYRVRQIGNFDFQATTAYIGYSGDVTPVFHVRAGIGLLSSRYDDPAFKDSLRPSFDVNALWSVTPLTSIGMTATRTIQNGVGSNATAQVLTTLELSAEHELLRSLVISTALANQTATSDLSEGDDKRWRGRVAARWSLNRRISFDGVVGAEKRRFAANGDRNYDAFSVRIGLGLAL